MVSRTVFILGGLLSAFSVVLGAFGAHGLKDRITSDHLQVFETGVRYQFFHAMALILMGLMMDKYPGVSMRLPIFLFIAGIILFSGSLYLLSTREIIGIDHWKSILGPVTPLGGLCFIAGWLSFTFSFWRSSIS